MENCLANGSKGGGQHDSLTGSSGPQGQTLGPALAHPRHQLLVLLGPGPPQSAARGQGHSGAWLPPFSTVLRPQQHPALSSGFHCLQQEMLRHRGMAQASTDTDEMYPQDRALCLLCCCDTAA